jgi:molybdenum cofactor biosynthesis protein B
MTAPDTLRFAVLTISDSRGSDDDASGDLISQGLSDAGHRLVERRIVADDRWQIRAAVSAWVADKIDVVITTGSTGVTGRDVAPEALEPLFDKPLSGFGELFRQLSYDEIGASAIQSRATAGRCDHTLVFVLPGSPGACRLGVEKILLPQLDSRTKPCNFASLRDRFGG